MMRKRSRKRARWSEDRHVTVATFVAIVVVFAVVFGVGYWPQIAAAFFTK